MTVKRVSCACCSLLLLTALAGCKGGSEMAPETLGRAGEITASAPELDAFARAEARKSLEELEYEGKERGLRSFSPGNHWLPRRRRPAWKTIRR